ncbi:MAG: CPBP family intramembrane metalloprotease [Lachnospiraceae bacterium]|nr:CPBP family intramembrane metalloprotease [Lachnospiraceae bacterium]MBQ7636216.1 CPBP family intramembrane metalloprotease [Lachnospiraceae bacterium]
MNKMENNTKIQPEEERYVPQEYRENKNPVVEILICFLIMLLFLAIQVVVAIPFVVIVAMSKGPGFYDGLSADEMISAIMSSIDTMTLSFVTTLVSLIVAVIWYRMAYCKGYGMNELKQSCRRIIRPDIIAGLFFAAIALYFITILVVGLISAVSPKVVEDYNELMEDAGINDINTVVILMTVVLAPINEECIMRGIILTRLKRKMAPVAAIVLSAVYFGVFHLNLVQGIYAGIMGLFMAYIAYKYGSIIPSIIFHAMFNGLNYLLMLLPASIQENGFLLFAVPVVSGFAWYFLEGRKKLSEKG